MVLNGKTAIVTGGGSGIGSAIARRFASEEAKVVVADINLKTAETTVDSITKSGGTAISVECDVSKNSSVNALVERAYATFGRIDILVNNAGRYSATPFLELDESEWDSIISVNLKGMFLCGQAVARQMVKDAGGVIVNMSSINAVVAIPNAVAYSVSKGGINQLTKVMALVLAPHNIRVNAIGPGTVLTGMTQDMVSKTEVRKSILSRTPMGRIAQPEEIANIAVFLASDESSYLTGTIIYADGGRLALNGVVPVSEPKADSS